MKQQIYQNKIWLEAEGKNLLAFSSYTLGNLSNLQIKTPKIIEDLWYFLGIFAEAKYYKEGVSR